MTWIVGGPGLVAPFLAGDICITFEFADGRTETHDCLQKIYPIGRNVLGGFAGSVNVGLRILEVAARHVGDSNFLDLPSSSVRWFPELARQVYSEASAAEQEAGCQILLVGVHPTLDRSPIPVPRTDAVRYVWPRFEPELTTNTFDVLGIGSGDVLDELRSAAVTAVRSNGFHRTDDFQFAGGIVNREGDLQLQLRGGLGGPAAKMAFALRHALTRSPIPGVSKWFVYGWASLTDPPVIEAPIYASVTYAGAQSRLAPPAIAVGRAAYERFLQAKGLRAAAAVG